jgi:YidC/Oxa1 family membrane protein insertase
MSDLKGSGKLVTLIKDNNANLNVQLVTNDNTLNTKDLFFEPTLTKMGRPGVVYAFKSRT